ncbi:hypothetical protein QYF36_015956 [Acer negundo]|nr:hypothetical protein QYF36_015956 [Acer negundo]
MPISTANGILVNTWEDLESKTFVAQKDAELLGRVAKALVYPIGPLARLVGNLVQRSQMLDWLDTKPRSKEIKKMVRRIMVDKEGHAMRSKVKEVKCSAEKALSRNGSSYNSLSQVVEECEIKLCRV